MIKKTIFVLLCVALSLFIVLIFIAIWPRMEYYKINKNMKKIKFKVEWRSPLFGFGVTYDRYWPSVEIILFWTTMSVSWEEA